LTKCTTFERQIYAAYKSVWPEGLSMVRRDGGNPLHHAVSAIKEAKKGIKIVDNVFS